MPRRPVAAAAAPALPLCHVVRLPVLLLGQRRSGSWAATAPGISAATRRRCGEDGRRSRLSSGVGRSGVPARLPPWLRTGPRRRSGAAALPHGPRCFLSSCSATARTDPPCPNSKIERGGSSIRCATSCLIIVPIHLLVPSAAPVPRAPAVAGVVGEGRRAGARHRLESIWGSPLLPIESLHPRDLGRRWIWLSRAEGAMADRLQEARYRSEGLRVPAGFGHIYVQSR